MKPIKRFFFLLLPTLFLMGCPNSLLKGLNNTTDTNSSYSYNFTENGCSTGNHSFSNQTEMCDGLRNDSLNNYCAQTSRYNKFQSDCPGRTW